MTAKDKLFGQPKHQRNTELNTEMNSKKFRSSIEDTNVKTTEKLEGRDP